MTRGTRPVPAIDSNAEDARLVGLVHVSDDDPGIRRRRAGKGFSYVDAEGNRIADRLVIQRIRKLAIPPAYADVWICSNPRGLQATGRSARAQAIPLPPALEGRTRSRQVLARDRFRPTPAAPAARART
jgi:DNA topoisomerase IB